MPPLNLENLVEFTLIKSPSNKGGLFSSETFSLILNLYFLTEIEPLLFILKSSTLFIFASQGVNPFANKIPFTSGVFGFISYSPGFSTAPMTFIVILSGLRFAFANFNILLEIIWFGFTSFIFTISPSNKIKFCDWEIEFRMI